MDDTTLVAGLIGILVAIGAFLFGLSRGRKVTVSPGPPVPSPTQKQQDQKVKEALEQVRKLKEDAEKLVGEEKQQALDKMHAQVIEDSRELADDPDALNEYLLNVGKEIRE